MVGKGGCAGVSRVTSEMLKIKIKIIGHLGDSVNLFDVCSFKDSKESNHQGQSLHLTPRYSIQCTPGTSPTSYSPSEAWQAQIMPSCIPSTLETTLKIPNR